MYTQQERLLSRAAAERPLPYYADWWPMGSAFLSFISEAILTEWNRLTLNDGSLETVRTHLSEYLHVVYGRTPRASLLEDFVNWSSPRPIYSGEFDAISYAFYRAAFELIEGNADQYDSSIEIVRRLFCQRVGKLFYRYVDGHLRLELPTSLDNKEDLAQLKACLQALGGFMHEQGYLRNWPVFSLSVDVSYRGSQVRQSEAEFLEAVHRHTAYALYEMSYPAIFPAAVYLYKLFGEAQHYSSRTIQEMFQRLGYAAHETDDFDPGDLPEARVVELWTIKRSGPDKPN